MSLITKQLLSRLPKTELHLHLDGSLPFEFILKRAVERNVLLPATTSQELRNYIHDLKTKARKIDPEHTQMAGKNWGVFDWCNQFLQTKEELKDAASLICKNIERDHNVKRVELRFCPTLHTLEGLTPKEAVEAVVEGVPDTGGVIICALRSNDAQHSLEMAQLTIETNNQTNGKVCGFDIAGDEGSYPLHIHQESIKLCKTNQIPVTVHAGEWPNTCNNIDLCLDLNVNRIGHGWCMSKDIDVMKRCIEKKVPVEICLTSNVKPGAGKEWIETYEQHPVRQMYDAGVKLCINSDNLLISGGADREANPTTEIEHFMNECQFSLLEICELLRNGVDASFYHTEEERMNMLSIFDQEIQNILSEHQRSFEKL